MVPDAAGAMSAPSSSQMHGSRKRENVDDMRGKTIFKHLDCKLFTVWRLTKLRM